MTLSALLGSCSSDPSEAVDGVGPAVDFDTLGACYAEIEAGASQGLVDFVIEHTPHWAEIAPETPLATTSSREHPDLVQVDLEDARQVLGDVGRVAIVPPQVAERAAVVHEAGGTVLIGTTGAGEPTGVVAGLIGDEAGFLGNCQHVGTTIIADYADHLGRTSRETLLDLITDRSSLRDLQGWMNAQATPPSAGG